jgi:hypothetical protein
MTTDIRNCSGNFSRSISSTPVGTTEIENKSKNISWNTDGTVLVAEIENRTDIIGLFFWLDLCACFPLACSFILLF